MDVERGPDWLFVRLHGDEEGVADESDLADQLLSLMEREFTHRLVLELDDVELLHSRLMGQLVRLHKRICMEGGLLRLCGLSPQNLRALQATRLEQCLPLYSDRSDAVMARQRIRPR